MLICLNCGYILTPYCCWIECGWDELEANGDNGVVSYAGWYNWQG